MRLNRLDLNLLVALDALLTERSITVAAERICLSQPATSGALSRLREFFDDELLVRVGSKMQPTPLGESLAESQYITFSCKYRPPLNVAWNLPLLPVSAILSFMSATTTLRFL